MQSCNHLLLIREWSAKMRLKKQHQGIFLGGLILTGKRELSKGKKEQLHKIG